MAIPNRNLLLPMQNADPWIEVDGGITPANAYKVSQLCSVIWTPYLRRQSAALMPRAVLCCNLLC